MSLLAAHLTEDNSDELMAAATHRSKSELERLLAERFPRPDVLAWVEAIPAGSGHGSGGQLAPGQVSERKQFGPDGVGVAAQLAPGQVRASHAPGRVDEYSRVKPLAPQRFAVQFTLSQEGHDQLRYAQELLGHQIPSGDIAQVFERALDALIERLEQVKFAATETPRAGRWDANKAGRHVPAHVRRAVWERDGGQ